MRAGIAASVAVSAAVRVPGALIGTFTQNVTAPTFAVTKTSRCEPANEALHAGRSRLQIAADGVATFDDPDGRRRDKAFAAAPGGTITLQVPANWWPSTARQINFCDAEPIGSHSWVVRTNSLVFTVNHDRCAGRNSILAGTWTRTRARAFNQTATNTTGDPG